METGSVSASCSTTPAAYPTTGQPSNGRCTDPRQGRLRDWTPQALVALVADRPPDFPPGAAWSYSNTGYILLGLVVEAAGGRTLAQELHRRILGPLGLCGTSLPDDASELPSPMARGYSLPVGPRGEALDGPLLDFTVQSPSWAWAAGGLVSDLQDLTGFFRALLGGRLLSSGLLAEMLPSVSVPPGSIPLPLYDRYGLGAPGDRDARRPPDRPRRGDPGLPQHDPEHPGRSPATGRHDQPAGRSGRRVRSVHAGVSRVLLHPSERRRPQMTEQGRTRR